MTVHVIEGDSLLVLPTLEADSFHAIVTDPPYGLEFMGKEWDGSDGFRRSLNEADAGRDDVFGRTSKKAPEFKTGANWQTGAGFSKPGIGERETSWPSFTGGNDQFGGANPTCATCGGRARGKKKCACAEPDWRVKGAAPDRQYGRHRQMLTYQEWCTAWARECLRVLKPGGHLLAFGGTRTYHRLAAAIEDAGFEIRDAIMWHYGSGFPKSHDVSKAIDKAAGAKREIVGIKVNTYDGANRDPSNHGNPADQSNIGKWGLTQTPHGMPLTADPRTDAAREWSGWGTALKPATEIICVARKPLIGTVAANVQAHGCGALNIEGCRVETEGRPHRVSHSDPGNGIYGEGIHGSHAEGATALGRWPANLIHDGSEEVLAAFPIAPGQMADASTDAASMKTQNVYGAMARGSHEVSASRRYTEEGSTDFAALPGARRGDVGSAARFFYCAKAGKDDRAESKHPTVKPQALMRYLVRLVTPKGGRILDPFAGSGSTGQAAMAEGFDCTLIELDPQSAEDCRRRIAHVSGQDAPLFAAAAGK